MGTVNKVEVCTTLRYKHFQDFSVSLLTGKVDSTSTLIIQSVCITSFNAGEKFDNVDVTSKDSKVEWSRASLVFYIQLAVHFRNHESYDGIVTILAGTVKWDLHFRVNRIWLTVTSSREELYYFHMSPMSCFV